LLESILELLGQLDAYYANIYNDADDKKNRIIQYFEGKSEDENFASLRKAFHNEYLGDLVKKVFEKTPVLRYGNELFILKHPIYIYPDNTNFLGFRTHFYAPKKYFLGTYFDTFWFNLSVVWVMTIVFYITLYYNHLQKLLSISFRFSIPKKKKFSKKRPSLNTEE